MVKQWLTGKRECLYQLIQSSWIPLQVILYPSTDKAGPVNFRKLKYSTDIGFSFLTFPFLESFAGKNWSPFFKYAVDPHWSSQRQPCVAGKGHKYWNHSCLLFPSCWFFLCGVEIIMCTRLHGGKSKGELWISTQYGMACCGYHMSVSVFI